ncbi:hypothetical protein [Deinococcus yavapaiensis]|nr:hypothetical protein [Deinococcus yavapaiensis]
MSPRRPSRTLDRAWYVQPLLCAPTELTAGEASIEELAHVPWCA